MAIPISACAAAILAGGQSSGNRRMKPYSAQCSFIHFDSSVFASVSFMYW